MGLLEREAELAALSRLFASAADGRGGVALVSGEAGIGKTSLVGAAIAALPAGTRVLRGACDDLIAPRSFGPLQDAARGTAGPLAAAVAAGADREAVFEAVFAELGGSGGPAVLVVEDVHWADDATLDLVRLLGRRVADLPAVVVLTFRDDEVAEDHPLRRLLGALVGPHVSRLPLARLSRARRARSSPRRSGWTARRRWRPPRATRSSSPRCWPTRCETVPPTVADAVLARVMQLDAATRSRVEQLAVVVAPAARSLVEALPGGTAGLVAAERLGIVEFDGRNVVFRHDLTRRAIEASLPGRQADRAAPAGAGPPPGRAGAGPAEGGAPRRGGGQRGGDRPVRAAGRSASRAQRREPAGARRPGTDVAPRRPAGAERAGPPAHRARLVAVQRRALRRGPGGRRARGERCGRQLDDPVGLSEALVTLGRQLLMSSRPRSAEHPARRALAVLDAATCRLSPGPGRDVPRAQLVLTDQPVAALPHLEEALELALAALRRHDRAVPQLRRARAGGRRRSPRRRTAGQEPGADRARRCTTSGGCGCCATSPTGCAASGGGRTNATTWRPRSRRPAASTRWCRCSSSTRGTGRWSRTAATGPRRRPGCGRCWSGTNGPRRHGRLHGAARAGPYPGAERAGRRGPPDARRRLGARPRGRRPRRAGAHRDRPGRAGVAHRPGRRLAGGRGARARSAPTGPATRHYRGELLRQLRRLGEPGPPVRRAPGVGRGHGDGGPPLPNGRRRGQSYERALELIDSDEPERSPKGSWCSTGWARRPPRPWPAPGCGSWASPGSRGDRARRRGRTSPG